MSPEEETLRFERKAYVDHLDRQILTGLVRRHPALFREIHHERMVNSLYFDTRSFSNAFEKIDGLGSRRKVRVRWYGDLFGNVRKPHLEIKAKENQAGWKIRYPLSPFVLNSQDQSEVNLEFPDETNSLAAKNLLKIYSPSVLISYRRKYFLSADSRFRLTIDDLLKSFIPGMSNRGWIQNGDGDHGVILELKYAKSDDDDAQNITGWFPFRWGTFSKYVKALDSVI